MMSNFPHTNTRQCPFCGELIDVTAMQCPFCAEAILSTSTSSQPQNLSVQAANQHPHVGCAPGEKVGGTAVLLDFILPGVGHLYGSAGQRGTGLLVANIILGIISAILFAVLPPLAIPTFIIQLILWITAMSTARSVVEQHNLHLRKVADEKLYQAKLAAQEEERKRQAAKASEELHRRQKQADDAKWITGHAVSDELSKIANLRKMDIINDTELETQKESFYQQLTDCYTKDSLGNFFMPIGKLLESGAIDQSDLKKLKKIYPQIFRK